jgi:hypothetical protein
MVSGSFSLPCSGFFSPFPHGTGTLSVSQEYLALADGPAGFAQGFTCPALLRVPLSVTVFARTGLSPSTAPLSRGLRFIAHRTSWPYNPAAAETATVWAAPLSLAATHGITLVFFSSGYLDVSVRRVRPPCGVPCLQHGGLPHSDARGSSRVCRSPRIFAAYRVLHRLWEPRHPPYALIWPVARYLLICYRRCTRAPARFFFPAYAKAWTLCAPCPNMSMNFSCPQKRASRPGSTDKIGGALMGSPHGRGLGGEYRSRTDGLLRARQAL